MSITAMAASGAFTLTRFELVMASIVAVLTALTTLALGFRWIYRQGAASQRLVDSIDRLTGRMDTNTTATKDLAESQQKMADKVDGTLLDHERRITRLEAR